MNIKTHRLALLFVATVLLIIGCGDDNKDDNDEQNTNSSDADAGSGDAGDEGIAKPRFLWDWTGIVGTGQSLSQGGMGTPIQSTEQPYNNLKFEIGELEDPPWDANDEALEMVPLVEPIRPTDPRHPSPYPFNIDGETPHTVMGNQITEMVTEASGEDYITVHTVVGESGQGMSVIEKGAEDTGTTGRAYAATLFEAEAITRLAKEAEKTYGIGAILLTHGESDTGNMDYEEDMVRLWQDYNEDLKAITGQSEDIPLFVSQQHSIPSETDLRSNSTLVQWLVGVNNPGDIVCTGPKYQFTYSTDGIHMNPDGYAQYGEKVGEVFYEKVVLGRDWQPLQPTEVERDGDNKIRVKFHVPVPPLTWDEEMDPPHQEVHTAWADGKGFEVRNSDEDQFTITSVEIVEDDTVEITCKEDLPSKNLYVSYAMHTDGEKPKGGTFRWGQLKDSDPLVGGTTGTSLPNYCVSFELEVP